MIKTTGDILREFAPQFVALDADANYIWGPRSPIWEPPLRAQTRDLLDAHAKALMELEVAREKLALYQSRPIEIKIKSAATNATDPLPALPKQEEEA